MEDQLRKDINRGLRAKQLLEDDLLAESLAQVREFYINGWISATKPDLRESAWYLLHALDMFKQHLTKVLNDGSMANAKLQSLLKAPGRRAA